MLTPAFEITQTVDFLELSIKAPYTSVSEAEIFIEEDEIKFYAKPYFLRLHLPGSVVEDHRAAANYSSSEGVFHIKIPKVNPGQVFEGLDLLTKLLSPAKKTSSKEPVIEVISSENKENTLSNESEEEDFDWLIEQIPYNEPDISVDGPKYGFGNQRSGVFKRLQTELHDIIDLPDADSTSWSDRTRLREQEEMAHFDEDHYMADFCDTYYLEALLTYIPEWELELQNPEEVTFSDDEKERMMKLPRKEYLLDADAHHQCLLALVDILFAFAYNHRTTEGENNVESAWTISKLSSTLSWLQIHTNIKDTVCWSLRRSLVYPLHRNWTLAMKVFGDVQNIFTIGQKRILKCLLEIHRLLNESDPRYVLNDLYITDYCVWIQTASGKEFSSMAKHLNQVKISKEEMGFELDLIERACHLAECDQIDEVSQRMNTMSVQESEHTENSEQEEKARNRDSDLTDSVDTLSAEGSRGLYISTSSTESETEDSETECTDSDSACEEASKDVLTVKQRGDHALTSQSDNKAEIRDASSPICPGTLGNDTTLVESAPYIDSNTLKF